MNRSDRPLQANVVLAGSIFETGKVERGVDRPQRCGCGSSGVAVMGMGVTI